MNTTALPAVGRSVSIVAAAVLFAACTVQTALAPDHFGPTKIQLTTLPGTDTDGVITTLQRVTVR